MAHTVSLRPVAAEARFIPRIRPCRICGELSNSGTGFCPGASVFPSQYSIPIFVVIVLLLGQVGEARNVPTVLFQISGNRAQVDAFTLSYHSSKGAVVG
jgi:hypothetical protein